MMPGATALTKVVPGVLLLTIVERNHSGPAQLPLALIASGYRQDRNEALAPPQS
jgi:hypothetical protein